MDRKPLDDLEIKMLKTLGVMRNTFAGRDFLGSLTPSEYLDLTQRIGEDMFQTNGWNPWVDFKAIDFSKPLPLREALTVTTDCAFVSCEVCMYRNELHGYLGGRYVDRLYCFQIGKAGSTVTGNDRQVDRWGICEKFTLFLPAAIFRSEMEGFDSLLWDFYDGLRSKFNRDDPLSEAEKELAVYLKAWNSVDVPGDIEDLDYSIFDVLRGPDTQENAGERKKAVEMNQKLKDFDDVCRKVAEAALAEYQSGL